MQRDIGEDQPAAQDAGRGQLLVEHGGADHDDRDQVAIGNDRIGRGTKPRHAVGLRHCGDSAGTERQEGEPEPAGRALRQ